MKGIEIFRHVFLYSCYADDSTLFLRGIPSVKELIKYFNQFYHFSCLKANIEKCELAGIGFLKGVTEAVCGLKHVDLSIDTIKIYRIHFSYNKNVQMQNNFITAIKKCSTLFMEFVCIYPWAENYDIQTLAISKIVYLALITNVPKVIVEQLQKIQKISYGKNHVLK